MLIRARREEYQCALGRGERSINAREDEEQGVSMWTRAKSNNVYEGETQGETISMRVRGEE